MLLSATPNDGGLIYTNVNSRKDRRIDNEDLAQTWLAFIGFANEAVNEKSVV